MSWELGTWSSIGTGGNIITELHVLTEENSTTPVVLFSDSSNIVTQTDTINIVMESSTNPYHIIVLDQGD